MSEGEFYNIIISDIQLESQSWAVNDPRIRYVGLLEGMSISEKTNKVIDILHEEATSSNTCNKRTPTTRKKVLVGIFDEEYDGGNINWEKLDKCVTDINDANKSLHDVFEIVFSAANFQLDYNRSFDVYKFVMDVNEQNGMINCNPNKFIYNMKSKTGRSKTSSRSKFIIDRLDGSKKFLNELGKCKLRKFYRNFFKYPFRLDISSPSLNVKDFATTGTTVDMVITDINLQQEVLQNNNPQKIQYVYLKPDVSIGRMTKDVIQIMKSSEFPLRLIIAIFNYAAAKQVSYTFLERCVLDIDDAAHQMKRHEVVYSAAYFIPMYEHDWDQVYAFNNFLRVVNIRNKHSDCRPFKFQLFHSSNKTKGNVALKMDIYKNQLDGKHWQEYVNNTGLGETLSLKGMVHQNKFYQRFFEHNNFDCCTDEVDHTAHFLEKNYIAPLCKTDGYRTKFKWPEGTIFPLFKDYRYQLEDSSEPQDASYLAAGPSHHFVPMQEDFPYADHNHPQQNINNQQNDFHLPIEDHHPRVLEQQNELGAINHSHNNDLVFQHGAGEVCFPINQTKNDLVDDTITDEHELKILRLQQENDKIKQDIMLQELAINERKQKLLLAEKAIDLNKHRFNKIKVLDHEEERLLDEVLDDVNSDKRMLVDLDGDNQTNFDQQCSDFISVIKSQGNNQKDNLDQNEMSSFDKQCVEWNAQIEREETRCDNLEDFSVKRHVVLRRKKGVEEGTTDRLVNLAASGYHQQEFGERQHSRPRDHEQSGQREERGRDYRSRSRDRGEREKSRGNQDRHRERSRGNQSRGDNSRWKPDRSEGYEDGRKRSRGYEERQNRSRNDHDHRQSTEGRDGREKSRGQRDQRKERSRSGREERDRSRSGREERDRSRIGGEGRYRSSEYLERIRDTHGDTRGRDEATGRILRDEYGEYISSEVPTTSREGESRYSQRSDERSRDYERSKSYYQDRKGRSRSLEEYNPPRARSSTLEDFEPSNNHGPMARAPNLITEAAYFDDAAWDTSRPSRQGGQNTYRSRSRERSSSSTQEKQRAFQNQWGADAGPKPRLDSLENDFAVKPSNPKLPGAQLPQPVRSFRTRNIFNPKKSDSKKSNYNEDEEEIPGLDLPKPQPEPIAPTKPLRGRVLYPGDSALLTSRNQSFSASGPSTSLNPPTAQFGRPLNEGPNGIWNQSTGQPGGWNQSAGGPGGLNQSTGPPEGWNQSSGPPGSWNQSAGPQGTWNQSTGPPGGWNQSAGPQGNWNQSTGQPGVWNQSAGAPGGLNQSTGPPGGWNQSAGPQGNWNQSTGPPGGWNQSAGPQGNWNQSTGPHGDWNQSAGAPGGLNQSTGPHGGWNQSSGPPGRFNTGQWNQPGMPVSPPVVPVPDPQKIVELQNYIKRQESSKQLNNYRINI